MPQLHRGHIFHVAGSPDLAGAADALVHQSDGGLLLDEGGRIAWCGPWTERPTGRGPVTVVDHSGCFILPGFVDTHLHFPQVHDTDAFGGGQLLEWLERVVFPSEALFADADFARRSAVAFCDRLASVGTTTSLVFGSQFPVAQDALFEEARSRGLRMILGRTTMTMGPTTAAPLVTNEADAIRLVREEIERWHPLDDGAWREALQQVSVIPRYALSVTTTTLRALGELYDEFRDRGVYFTSHLSENNRSGDGEISAVRESFGVHRYLDVYDGHFLPGSRHGGSTLLGRRSVLAHAVHCNDGELARLAQTGSSIAHCPVSQQFLGSGTMPWLRTMRSRVNVSIGSDIGAGDEWFIPRVLNACFKAHIDEPGVAATALHPAQLLFTATLAGARALDLDDRIGNFDVGKDADFVVIDPSGSPDLDGLLNWWQSRADPLEDRDAMLFTVLMASRESGLTQSYVRGRRMETGGRDER